MWIRFQPAWHTKHTTNSPKHNTTLLENSSRCQKHHLRRRSHSFSRYPVRKDGKDLPPRSWSSSWCSVLVFRNFPNSLTAVHCCYTLLFRISLQHPPRIGGYFARTNTTATITVEKRSFAPRRSGPDSVNSDSDRFTFLVPTVDTIPES